MLQPQGVSLQSRLEHHAATRPDELALVFLSRSAPALELSWAQLDNQVRTLANQLVRAGVSPGDVTFVLSASPAEQALGFLGAMAAGALPSILSFPSLKQSEARFHEMLRPITQATGARWVLASEAMQGVVTRAELAVGVVPLRLGAGQPEAAELPSASGDFLQFSSGTTGLRKCVRITREMLVHQAAAYAQALALEPGDRIASWLPLYHDMGLVACLLLPLFQGNASVHMSPFDWLAEPALLLRAVSTWQASLVWLPNFAYRLCAEQIRDESLREMDLGSLRAIINCSEPVREASHELFARRFQGWGVRPELLQACYAMAESTFAVTQTPPGQRARVDRVRARLFSSEHRALPAEPGTAEAEALTFVSCGRPIPGIAVRIAGGAGERQVGEIEVRGGSVIPGYGVDGGQLLESFTADGWYRTGDLGYLAEGELFVTGRAKDLIIHRGHNIYPGDMEECLAEVPGVKPGRTVVFGLYDESAGTEDVIVMLEPDGDGRDADALRRQVREQVWLRLNVAVADVDVCAPGSLLKSTSGKLSRSANRRLYQERRQALPRASRPRTPRTRPYTEPRDLWERQLAWIWEDVLGASPIGVEDNPFLDWGADSVSALRAAAEVERRLDRRVQPAELLGAQTVEGQAALLRGTQSGESSPLVLLQPHGQGRPLVLVHAASGWAFPYVSLVRRLGTERRVYCLQAPHLVRGGAEQMTVESLATEYLAALRAMQPRGPYLLGGWSFGGLVAFEMASRLQAEGESVAGLLLFDTRAPPRAPPKWGRRLRGAAQGHVLRLALRVPALRPLLRSQLQPLQALTPVWRFFACFVLTGSQDVRPILPFAFPDVDRQRLATLDVDGAWDYAMELARRSDAPADRALLLPGLDGAGARKALGVSRQLERIYNRYRTDRRYRGVLDIIGVRGNTALERWQAYVEGPVAVHWADVEKRHVSAHFDMMEEANVGHFADRVSALLRKADA